jgi:hypothetical protein
VRDRAQLTRSFLQFFNLNSYNMVMYNHSYSSTTGNCDEFLRRARYSFTISRAEA